MSIYIIEVDFMNHETWEIIFRKTAAICYKALDDAIQYVRSQSDYRYSVNSYLHVGLNHRYTIRSVTLI